MQNLPIYLIDWYGCEPNEDSWEPNSSLIECELSLEDFYKSPHRLQNGVIWRDLPNEKDRLWCNESYSPAEIEELAADYLRRKFITDDDVSRGKT